MKRPGPTPKKIFMTEKLSWGLFLTRKRSTTIKTLSLSLYAKDSVVLSMLSIQSVH